MGATVIGDLFVRLGLDAVELNNGLLAAEKRLDRFGTQLFFLGSRITAGVSLPLGLALDKIAEFGMGFDKAMTESLAIMDNVSTSMRKDMESVAVAVSNTTKFSSEEAAKGFYGLASAGLDASAAMGALPVAARFAQAGVMDLAKATDFLATAQAAMATGTQSSAQKVADMARVADVLTMANNKAIGTIQDFAEALTNKAGAALRQSNKSIEEGTAVLMAYASQGIKGKEAGQQLWMSIRDLGISALKHQAAFKKFGISVFDASGAMHNMADIIADVEKATDKMSVAERRDMFIKLGMPSRSIAATTALIGLSGAIRTYQTDVTNAGGATQTVADKQMTALSNQMVQLGNQFKNAAIELFTSFIPVIQNTLVPLMKDALAVVQDFVKGIAAMPDWLKLAGLAAAGLAVAIGPVVAFIGSMSLLTSAAARGLGLLSSGFSTMAISMGLLVGPSTMLTKFLTFMPKQAALAAAAAYDLAKAQGVSGIFLNNAATAAANAAGWQGKVTNALVAQSTAQATANNTMLAGLGTTGLVAAGIVALGAAVLATQSYTKDWGETLKVWTIPGYGMFKLLTDLNDKLIEHGGVLGDVARIMRDTFSLVYDRLKRTLDITLKAIEDFSTKAYTLFKVLFGGIDDMVRTQLERAATVVSLLPGGETNLRMIYTILAALPALKRELNASADAMDRLAGFGTFKGSSKVGKNMLTGGMDPFNMPQKKSPFFVSPTGAPSFGNMPPDPTKMSAAQKAAESLAQAWLDNSKQLNTFKDAWERLTPVQRASTDVLDNVWQAYDKLRQTQGVLIPQFEDLFAMQIKNQEGNKASAFAANEWGIVYSDAAIKVMDSVFQVQSALNRLSTKGDIDAFWAKMSSSMDELVPRYAQQSSGVQMLIDEYQRWQLATAKLTGTLHDLKQQADKSIGDYLQDTVAKLTDARAELTLFSHSYMDRELIGLKKGLAQQELARERSYQDQIKHLAMFADDPAMFAAEKKRLDAANANNKAINEAAYRLGLIRLAQSVGVNKHIIEDFDKMSNEVIKDIIRQKLAWDDLSRTLHSFNAAISATGSLFTTLGAAEAGQMFSSIGAGLDSFMKGADTFANADTLGEKITGIMGMVEGTVKAFQALNDVGSKAMRAVGGAIAGAQIGAALAGPWGAVAGAVIGGLVGAFKADPDWKMVQKTVQFHWHENVSKALANQIDKDADMLGGHVNSMMMHLVDIANESGGIGPGSVGMWAANLAQTFDLVNSGAMSATQGAKTLDNAFGELLKVGTATDGLINDQVRSLVLLERQYKTGSQAIKDFVNAQLTMAATGLNAVSAGMFGTLLGSLSDAEAADTKLDALRDKAAKLQATIADFAKKPPTTEKQKLQLLLAERDLLATNFKIQQEQARQAAADVAIQKLMGEKGQEQFDRLGRMAAVTFNAMIASGKSFMEALDAIGPTLDILSLAQEKFGFTSNDTFNQLMKFREFAKLNPELVAMVGGLQQLMVGLSNTGFLTQAMFTDLGATATDTFNQLVAQGLTGDEALQVMQPTLQTLWELQKKFGFSLDDATQALLDQAEASGTVGEKYMSANDRMVLGIQTLIDKFDLFLHHLGIDTRTEAEKAADAINEASKHVKEWKVPYRWEAQNEPPGGDGRGGGNGGDDGSGVPPGPATAYRPSAEAFPDMTRTFQEFAARQAANSNEMLLPLTVQMEGEAAVKAMIKVGRRNGWIKG